MIRRETSAELINTVANARAVLPSICYHGNRIDWTPAVESERCIVLSNGEDAVAVFELTSPRFYQVHLMFDETCRGAQALEVARSMIAYLVPAHADALWGASSSSNPQARWFVRQLGAKPMGREVFEVEGEVEIFFLGSTH